MLGKYILVMAFNLIALIKEVALRRQLGIRPYGIGFEDGIIQALGTIPKEQRKDLWEEFKADRRLERKRESEE